MENLKETMFGSAPFTIEGRNYKSNAVLVAEREARRATIVILKNDYDEYQVPERDGEFYFTDDRDDAIGTACAIYGANVKVTFRRVH